MYDSSESEKLVKRDQTRFQLYVQIQVQGNDINSAALLLGEGLTFEALPFCDPATTRTRSLNQLRESLSGTEEYRSSIYELRSHHRRLLRETFRAREELLGWEHHVSAHNAFSWNPSERDPNYPYRQARSKVVQIAKKFQRIWERPLNDFDESTKIQVQSQLREEMHRANLQDLVRWFPELQQLIDYRGMMLWISLRFDLTLQSFVDIETNRPLDGETKWNRQRTFRAA